jgi:hypothetical protein
VSGMVASDSLLGRGWGQVTKVMRECSGEILQPKKNHHVLATIQLI